MHQEPLTPEESGQLRFSGQLLRRFHLRSFFTRRLFSVASRFAAISRRFRSGLFFELNSWLKNSPRVYSTRGECLKNPGNDLLSPFDYHRPWQA